MVQLQATKQELFSRIIALIPLFIYLLFLIIYLFSYKKVLIRYWDEHDWIARSYYFDLLIRNERDNQLWLTSDSYDQPKLAAYLYGARLYPHYLRAKATREDSYGYVKYLIDNNFYRIDSNKHWLYKKLSNTYINWGENPIEVNDIDSTRLIEMFGTSATDTIATIWRARTANVILLPIAVAIVYLIISLFASKPIALITAFTTGANYQFTQAGLRAQSDGLFIVLFIISSYLIIILLNRISRGNYYFLPLLAVSITLPLLNLTKINGIMLLFFLTGYLGILFIKLLLYKKLSYALKISKSLFTILFVFFLIWVSFDFYILSSPIKSTINMYIYRKEKSIDQVLTGYPYLYMPTFSSRINTIYKNFFFDPVGQCNLNGFAFSRFECNKHYFIYGKLTFFLWGFIIFIRRYVIDSFQARIFLFLFIFIQIMIGLYYSINFDRYFIVLIPFIVFFQVLGIVYITRSFYSWMRLLLASKSTI